MHKDPNNSSQDIFFTLLSLCSIHPFFPVQGGEGGGEREEGGRGRRRGRRAGLSNEEGSLDSGG